MRVFVTGASGWIGSGVVPELIAAGHDVLGLARSEASAVSLEAAGAEVLYGSLEDLESLRTGAAKSDGVIHLAFIHDFSRYQAAIDADLHAIEALGSALEGSDRPLVIASGILAQRSGGLATEDDPPRSDFPRSAAANLTVGLAERGVRSSVVRLPPTVHGKGDDGFVPTLINTARTKGVSGFVADGANRWPAVHRDDAAALFRLAVETAPAGSVLHAIGDEGVQTRAIAQTIGDHLGLPVVSIPTDDAGEHFGWLGVFFAADVAASSARTQERMGWRITRPGLIEDLNDGHYFLDLTKRGIAL